MDNLIVGLRQVPAESLIPNPDNWRTHPTEQAKALRTALAGIGYAVPIIARELPDKSLRIIDGHLRATEMGAEAVPVIVIDVTDEQERALLATIDPLVGLAASDDEALAALSSIVARDDEVIAELLNDLHGDILPDAGEPPDDPGTEIGRAEEL